MKPIIAIQIISRAILWIFIFAAEIIQIDIMKQMPQTYLFYLTVIALCFYDIVVHCIGMGLAFYIPDQSLPLYVSLCYAILILKFARLLWPAKTADGSALVGWPTFGPVGYLRTRAAGANAPQSLASPKQNEIAYGVMMATLPSIYLLHIAGLKMKLSFWAAIVLCIIVLGFKRFNAYLEAQHVQQMANENAAAVAAVTAAKNAELEAKNNELLESNRQRAAMVADLASRNEILRDASHDLAPPLWWIRLCIKQQVLAQDDTSRAALAQQALDAVEHFGGLLDDTIHNAKITTMLEAPKIAAIPVSRLTNWLQKTYQDAYDEKDVWLKIYKTNQFVLTDDGVAEHDDAPIPPGLDFAIATDERVIKRILSNLIGNALRHTAAKGYTLVAFRKRPDHTCWIEVRDTGSGIVGADGSDWATNFIDVAHNIKIGHMEPEQAASHGLGINNVKNLCATLGVPVMLHSRVGRGSLFRFIIPLADIG